MAEQKQSEPDYLQVLQRWVNAIHHDSDDPQAEAKRLCGSIGKIVAYLEENERSSFEEWVLEATPRQPSHGHDEKAVMRATKDAVEAINFGSGLEPYLLNDLAYTVDGHIYCDVQRLASMATFIHFCETEDNP